ncbi:glutathione-regulated potassium-efflux system protein KefC [Ramlibacter rhizophilus]|uniref:Glutathione-regulated potassium-efflux system protein KefC n=1 Tax=Ramlibacter rhizophilus TaxID=1781167 RepID=A0A4Z0BS59_9BURK|nr:glutathione-regulated potassium-efflux system protein KefC [Ramlibacter rhizophilus]TFZ01098.1 glutathione-regulated potassium-efflux system protein KefC [Ramlibacter rhizophilus]
MDHAPVWLTHTLIYLAAAVLAVPLTRALGLSAVLGYLAAGIVIGPAGFGLVTDVQAILHFAELGVVLMLFLIGLELEPRRLWTMRRPIFGWGSAQVLGCTALLFAAGWLAGASWTLALVAALGLSLSSTAIALQVMNERNILGTPAGQAGFSILLFQDVAAIPILALVPLLGAHDAAASIPVSQRLLEALQIVATIAAIILGGRLLLRPVFRWIARSRTTEIFTAAALLLVVLSASLMLSVGLSMALGAFLAGVLLADSEYRRELETDLEPFKGLLLGLFFIAVGMSIDFAALRAAPGLVAALVIGLLAIKGALIWTLGGALRLARPDRTVFTLLLAQGGEFAFVVFQAATGARVIDAPTSSLLVGSVAISMLLGPLLLAAMDRWLMPRWSQPRRLPEISEPQDAPVIIAGFGRYGQIVARLLAAQGVASTLLDHDADMVEAARAFGSKVFYGDARRLDLLRIAGADKARVLVVAVDDEAQCLAIVDTAQAHFPHLQLVVRARDVTHWNKLRDRGVRHVQRELFESSLRSGMTVLQVLGMDEAEVAQQAGRFRTHNLALFEQMYPHYKDRARLIAVARQGREQFEQQMAQERADAERARLDPAAAPDPTGETDIRA